MASGGPRSTRTSQSEPKKRTSSLRLDSEERSSIGSSRQEDRPNNWEFSDWQPSSAFDSGKRIKKGNEEKERERGQSQEGSSQGGDRTRQKTPSTFPRTKMTSATPLAERLALQNLRQHLTFSDNEEVTDSAEKNNERYVPKRKERPTNYVAQDTCSSRNEVQASGGGDNNRDNRNINKEDGPDSTQIVGRLMQIRDYIKQATSMMDGLKRSTDPGDLGRARQLDQVVQRLKEQEQKYLDILLRLSAKGPQLERLTSLLNHLQEQEYTYVGYLKTLLGVNDFDELLRPSSTSSANINDETSSVNINDETESEAVSVDLDVASDSTSNTTDDNEEQGMNRPVIEDHLGRHSDTEADEPLSARSSKTDTQSELENTMVNSHSFHQRHQNVEQVNTPTPQLVETRKRLENDLVKKNDELEALRQQHDLLKKMLNQQEQLRALQGRQEALLAIQRDAEIRLRQERTNNEVNAPEAASAAIAAVGSANAETLTQATSIATDAATEGDDVPRELKDLRRRLNYLKNIYDIKDSASGPSEDVAESEDASVATSVMSVHRHHLEDKLQELQEKRYEMEDLMKELQELRREQKRHLKQIQLHNEFDSGSTSSSQNHMLDGMIASTTAGHTAKDATEVLQLLETRKKLKKLQDVRERLNQLRDLVQYYQSGTEFIHGDDDQSSLPAYEDHYGTNTSNLREVKPRDTVANRLKRYAEGDTSRDTSQQASETGSVQDTTDAESQMSDLVAWGEDPEVQDKVRKLKMAKEKLRRLQDLVAMVQQSPAQALPDDLAALAAGFDSDVLSELAEINQDVSQQRRSPASSKSNQQQSQQLLSQPPAAAGAAGASYLASPSLTMTGEQREMFYKKRMQEQRAELEQLVDERRKLLAIQDHLQRLHDQLPGGQSQGDSNEVNNAEENNEESEQSDENSTQLKSVNEGAQVTFQEPLATVASYDELYGKMRQHRMLREELREKKKELEFMMKKDRPRKQYFRNQDNQSDNISFSNKSDPFGTQSGDLTVATWGGSTADNMESIEEDENDSGDGQEADDGFPVDGILQVEEEEEEVDNDNSESDDNNTYTVEDDYDRDAGNRRTAGNRRSTGAPLLSQHVGRGRGRYQYNYWSPDNGSVLNNARTNKTRPPTRRKQQNLQAPEDLVDGAGLSGDSNTQEELKRLRKQLQETRSQLQGIQAGNNPSLVNQMTAQVQQQQLLLYQQMLTQQQENAERLRRLEQTVLRSEQVDFNMNPFHTSPYSQSPLLQPLSVSAAGRSGVNNLLTPAAGRDAESTSVPVARPFQFQPRPFTDVGNANSSSGGAYTGLLEAPQQLANNLYSAGSSNLDSGLSEAAQNITVTVNNTASPAGRLVQQRQQAMRAAAARSNFSSQSDRSHHYRVEDVVPIETIQASDQRVPPLNLNRVLDGTRNRIHDARTSECGLQRNLRVADIPEKKTSTPGRVNAASSLASRQVGQIYRPGLSAGISGTGYDTISMSSYVSSVPGGEVAGTDTASVSSAMRHQINIMESHEPRSEFSLFEALRETIYSEVATLISQNENRPHFLIELFRELQMLNNEYLRQRALYAIQDLVMRHLTDEDDLEKRQTALLVSNGTELTPSESLFTSDDEQVKVQLYKRNEQAVHLPRRDRFDYAEQVETVSTLSTPNSTTENPFSKESLGDTVIHLDKFCETAIQRAKIEALHRMREYERRLVEAHGETGDGQGASPVGLQHGARAKLSDATSSSAQDQGSEDSVSDVPDNSSVSEIGGYPRIDTQELDRQIKGVMTEVIPVLKEHMNDHCSQQLLQYIRRLVLSLTKHRDDSHEFVRFFHKQLESILHDSLAKFEGRKMRECSEDLLVELSEILFNELAFFRLMQDLDGPKKRTKQQLREWRRESESQDTGAEEEPMRAARRVNMLTSDSEFATESESEMSEVQHTARRVVPPSREEFEEAVDVVSEEDGGENEDAAAEDSDDERESDDSDYVDEQDDERVTAANEDEQEDLGKARDDELANQTEIKEDGDSDVHTTKSPMKFQLAQSELKSFTRIGSDEDDEGVEDETMSNEDPSETAVSRDAKNETEQPSADATDEANIAATETVPNLEKEEESEEPVPNNLNGQVNGHDVEDEVTLDDLPTKMVGLSKDELGNVAKQMAVESQQNNLSEEVLTGVNSELAGDPNALKDPGEISEKSEDGEEDSNVLYLTTPEGGSLIVAALDNSETEV